MGTMEMEQSPLCNKPYWHLGLIPPSQDSGDPPLELTAPPAESFLISAWRPNTSTPFDPPHLGLFGGPLVSELPGLSRSSGEANRVV